MTYSEATPKELLANIKALIANNVIPKYIYVGVDNLSYTIDSNRHISPSNSSYEPHRNNPIKFYSLYLDSAISFSSYIDIISIHKWMSIILINSMSLAEILIMDKMHLNMILITQNQIQETIIF